MLTIPGRKGSLCDGPTRRELLRVGSGSAVVSNEQQSVFVQQVMPGVRGRELGVGFPST